MYNGIGLNTPRGTGTNGFVQKNFAALRTRKDQVKYKTDEDLRQMDTIDSVFKVPHHDILEHDRKRKIELQCLELREAMEDRGLVISK